MTPTTSTTPQEQSNVRPAPKNASHRLFLAKISLALTEELRRRPTDEELSRVLRVVEQALTGLSITTTPTPEGEPATDTRGGSTC